MTRSGAVVVVLVVGEGNWEAKKTSAGPPCTTASDGCALVVEDMRTEGVLGTRSGEACLAVCLWGFEGCRWLAAA